MYTLSGQGGFIVIFPLYFREGTGQGLAVAKGKSPGMRKTIDVIYHVYDRNILVIKRQNVDRSSDSKKQKVENW